MGQVWFVGAGPGAADLITVRGARLLGEAGAVLYAGSLVSRSVLEWTREGCEIADSAGMHLREITTWLTTRAARHASVVRLQTGDPTLYGALAEMARPLERAGVTIGIVPGVSSAMAAAAAAGETLTLPEVTQTVILTRLAGRTPMPVRETLVSLAAHHCSLCIFLSIARIDDVVTALRTAGWSSAAPIVVVEKATWPGAERVLRGSLEDIAARCASAGLRRQAMILASPALGARHREEAEVSRLYDLHFSHGFRPAGDPSADDS
ncbi:precorrin-4 C(11)-methyltransferase [Thiocapsa imhoffii]|uniref:Precorrin-4 C(11)-methyltransferase n=1 Tax=Thiocapsa imhoffii TaxID=382777 RepID=A0A9X0WJE7_9GAMM|nr:precorrin-4 C(11)-methyltransferase [Thiocapsa imhoffii]MBK1645600.1 precorrin-4 C(11)-methyltransferase [Thiocapsa imhoffii]